MNSIQETKMILDEHSYPDVSGLILDYIYDKCVVCKKHTTKFLRLYDDNYICSKCVMVIEVNECQHCKKLYVFHLGADCGICRTKVCRLFCNYCKKSN